MSNLAQKLNQKEVPNSESGQVISFPKPSLLQEAIVNTQKNEDGYTPLPNFVCDEGYLATLSGEAVKCLVFLNRHIDGFHLDKKAMSEILVMKITGIKDKRTIRKYMGELEKFQLIRISKENGKSNVYFLTLNNRLPIKPVAQHVTGSDNKPVTQDVATPYAPVTCHVTTPVAQHVTATSDMACHSVKETYLKENIKDKKTNLSVDNSKSEMFGDSVEYHCDNKNLYSLKELSKVYPVQSDLIDQIVDRCPELTNEQIMSELKNFAQWSKGRDNTTAQGWMNYWIYRIQKLSAPKAKSQKPAKAKIKGLSESQIDLFASKLTDFHDFSNKYSTPGESEKAFKARIASKLREPEYLKKWASYLADVGFVGQLEDSV